MAPHSIRSFVDEIQSGATTCEYDVLVTKGARPLFAGMVSKAVHGTMLIYLCAEHRFYQIVECEVTYDSWYTKFKSLMGTYGLPLVKAIFSRGIDGVIAVSELTKTYVRQIVGDRTPIEVAHPFIQADLYRKLGAVEYDLESNIVTTVGRPAPYKGIDRLVEAWETVRVAHPEAELHIVGQGHPDSYEDVPGVTVRGWVEDIVDVYAESALYVQPSRVDAFPVTVLEALRAGVPAMVTEMTGTKPVVEQIEDQFVVPGTPSTLAERVNWFLDQSVGEKLEYSKQSRSLGEEFDRDTRISDFRAVFEEVV